MSPQPHHGFLRFLTPPHIFLYMYPASCLSASLTHPSCLFLSCISLSLHPPASSLSLSLHFTPCQDFAPTPCLCAHLRRLCAPHPRRVFAHPLLLSVSLSLHHVYFLFYSFISYTLPSACFSISFSLFIFKHIVFFFFVFAVIRLFSDFSSSCLFSSTFSYLEWIFFLFLRILPFVFKIVNFFASLSTPFSFLMLHFPPTAIFFPACISFSDSLHVLNVLYCRRLSFSFCYMISSFLILIKKI